MKKNKYSDFKIFNFTEKINSFKNQELTAPLYVRIKPINLCNHGCFFCVYSTGFRVKDGGPEKHIISGMHQDMQEKDQIPSGKMFEILDDLSEMGVKAVTYSGGGEPLMYKDIVKVMEQTLNYGIDLSIITNGQNLVKERATTLANAKWVRVSMDYTNGSQMKRFRNVPENSFESVIKNMESFSKIKNQDCDLGVNYIVHQNNCENLYEFTKLLKDCGVNNVRYSPMYTPEFYEYHSIIKNNVNDQLNKIKELVDSNFTVNSTYNIESGSSHSNIRSYKNCYIMQTVPVIGADCKVYACHNKAFDSSGCIGSIIDKRFKDLWFSEETKKYMFAFNAKKTCLHECSNDRKNILINNMLEANSDNFI